MGMGGNGNNTSHFGTPLVPVALQNKQPTGNDGQLAAHVTYKPSKLGHTETVLVFGL